MSEISNLGKAATTPPSSTTATAGDSDILEHFFKATTMESKTWPLGTFPLYEFLFSQEGPLTSEDAALLVWMQTLLENTEEQHITRYSLWLLAVIWFPNLREWLLTTHRNHVPNPRRLQHWMEEGLPLCYVNWRDSGGADHMLLAFWIAAVDSYRDYSSV